MQKGAGMSLYVTVPLSTEVIESPPAGTCSSAYEEGALSITVDTRYQHLPQRLGPKTPRHGGAENSFEGQELSALGCPIRSPGADARGVLPQGRQALGLRGAEARRRAALRGGGHRLAAGFGAAGPAVSGRGLKVLAAALGLRPRPEAAKRAGDHPAPPPDAPPPRRSPRRALAPRHAGGPCSCSRTSRAGVWQPSLR